MNEDSAELRRIRWQCRRGLLELDLWLSRLVSTHYEHLDAAARQDLKELLENPDQLLLSWFQGQQQPPEHLKKLIRLVI